MPTLSLIKQAVEGIQRWSGESVAHITRSISFLSIPARSIAFCAANAPISLVAWSSAAIRLSFIPVR